MFSRVPRRSRRTGPRENSQHRAVPRRDKSLGDELLKQQLTPGLFLLSAASSCCIALYDIVQYIDI